MGYVIGSDPGAFHIARQAGGPEAAMQLAGLYRKAMAVVRHGVNFVQLPLENISEFQEPDLENNMKKVKEMGIGFGIHGETSALGGEGAQMDSALKDNYIRAHQKIEIMLRESGRLGSKYLLLHSSESPGFLQLGREFQQTTIVDFWGRPINALLDEKTEEGKKLLNWAIEQKYIMELAARRLGEPDIKEYEKEFRDSREVTEAIGRRVQEVVAQRNPKTQEEVNAIQKEVTEDIQKNYVPKRVHDIFKNELLSFSETLSMTYATERVAYYIVAKFMEMKNEELWRSIVNSAIDYYSALAKKPREEWLKDNDIKTLSIDDARFMAKYVLWLPAVSAKYIWGHFNQDQNPSKDSRVQDLKKIVKDYKMPFVIETPMVSEEEMSRLPNPLQMYHVMKNLDKNGEGLFGVAYDIEHMLMANINPEVAFNLLPDDGGKYILVVHTGWPSPLGPAHLPIPLGSEQQVWLYKMYHILRNKGMGKDKDVYIIFERGGGEDPYKQSYLALRNIVDFLMKDTPPDQLPTEFYGIESKQILSVEKQMVAIREHALDPIKGLITVPEEEHGVLGKAALEKGKRPEEWAKERFR